MPDESQKPSPDKKRGPLTHFFFRGGDDGVHMTPISNTLITFDENGECKAMILGAAELCGSVIPPGAVIRTITAEEVVHETRMLIGKE